MRTFAAVAGLVLLSSPLALAQTAATITPASPAPRGAKPAKTATPSVAAPGANTTGHSAVAVDCSKQADAKGLHGKARASFRASCKAGAKKG